MANGHSRISRLAHRAFEEVRASVAIGSKTTMSEGFNAFRAKLDLQKMNRNGYYESPSVTNHLMRKHESVIKYLEARFGDFYQAYDYDEFLPPVPEDMANKIWMCWWQGEENAPALVRACIESVRRNAYGREVIVITDDNLHDYVDMPAWLEDKVWQGIVTRTNLSDFLRLSLLSRYGGLWLDATFYCSGELSGPVYEAPMFTVKRPDYAHGSIACGMFAGYSLGCDSNSRRLFAVARDYYLEYWKRSSFMVDYLLIDYLIILAQRHCPEANGALEAVVPNNPQCDELIKVLGDPFDAGEWERLKKDTQLFKLTWKQEYPTEIAGHKTYLAMLLDGDLK